LAAATAEVERRADEEEEEEEGRALLATIRCRDSIASLKEG